MQLRLAALVLVGALLCAAAPAPRSGIGGSGPLDVVTTRGGIDVNYKTCNGAITGGARITQGTVRLQAQSVVVAGRPVASNCDLNHFEATDQVFYVTPQLTVKADRAVYDAGAATAVFTGSGANGVIIVAGQNVMASPKVTINTASGQYTTEGGAHMVYFPETEYQAAGTGWTLATSSAALSLTPATGQPVDVANPGAVTTNGVLSWTTPSLKVTLTPGPCSFGGQQHAYVAQVQAGSRTFSGCGDAKSGGA